MTETESRQDCITVNMKTQAPTSQQVADRALSVGFDACGVSRADCLADEANYLAMWLGNGYHGDMGYMERNLAKRADPRLLIPSAKSIITTLCRYPRGDFRINKTPPKISRYALGEDYHKVVKGMLHQLLDILRKDYGEVEGRAFVDSAPVLERAWAARAGLGWVGKNSMLIHPRLGSFTFIGELIVDLEIEPAATPVPNRCGTCTRCIDACPTGAIVAPGVVDARRCTAYLTIEKKSPLTPEELNRLNGWCFGCDVCQEVCPWNGRQPAAKHNGIFEPHGELLSLSADRLRLLSPADFDRLFSGTPLARAGFERFSQCVAMVIKTHWKDAGKGVDPAEQS